MAEREVNNLNIPPEAIRTMRKDLAGITKGEWELTLAEVEIEELLRKFLNRQNQEEKKEETEKREETEKKEEIDKKKSLEEQKQREKEAQGGHTGDVQEYGYG